MKSCAPIPVPSGRRGSIKPASQTRRYKAWLKLPPIRSPKRWVFLRQSDDNPIRFVGLPLSIDGVRPSAGGHAPDLGEHDQQVFEFMCNDTAKEKV